MTSPQGRDTILGLGRGEGGSRDNRDILGLGFGRGVGGGRDDSDILGIGRGEGGGLLAPTLGLLAPAVGCPCYGRGRLKKKQIRMLMLHFIIMFYMTMMTMMIIVTCAVACAGREEAPRRPHLCAPNLKKAN